MTEISRRTFLQTTAVGAAAAAAVRPSTSSGQTPAAANAGVWKIGGFTKPIQELSPEETARVAVEIGWDGIELALRAGGHVLPERVDDDLPKMVAALKGKNKEVLVLATDIKGADALTEKVLRAAVKQGIRLYRTTMFRYRAGVSIPSQLNELRAQLKDLAALNKQLGITGMLQNHSGNGYVGAAVWDIHLLTEAFDPKEIGVHYDIGHATLEGGLSWPTNFALIKDRIGAAIVKDFVWKVNPGKGGTLQWVPIGQGLVNPSFFTMLKASAFNGPLTMQYEYPFENNSLEARVRALKADNAQVRAWLKG